MISELVVLALGASGAVSSAAGVVVAWLRRRPSDVTVTVTRPDGTVVEINAERVRGMNREELDALIHTLAEDIDRPPPQQSAPPT
jgi:hypothetical protein